MEEEFCLLCVKRKKRKKPEIFKSKREMKKRGGSKKETKISSRGEKSQKNERAQEERLLPIFIHAHIKNRECT